MTTATTATALDPVAAEAERVERVRDLRARRAVVAAELRNFIRSDDGVKDHAMKVLLWRELRILDAQIFNAEANRGS